MTALEQSENLGMRAAKARYRNHDQGLYSSLASYQSRFVAAAKPEERKALVDAFNAAYREEASYYIGEVR